jgi:hypothetical protein
VTDTKYFISQMSYRPLDPSKNEIRLVKLKSLSYNQSRQIDPGTIVCKLELTEYGQNIKYTALSYAWNTGGDDHEIILGDSKHIVSANLYEALLELREYTNDVVLWVDQLSINQIDDIEKGEQVFKMKDIYERADHVVVWLGSSADNSELVMATFQVISEYGPFDNSLDWTDNCDNILSEIVAILIKETHDLDWTEERVLDLLDVAYDALCQRAYWKRLWVIQEFAVARHLTIACGRSRLSFEKFGSVWWTLDKVRYAFEEPGNSEKAIYQIAYECSSYASTFVDGVLIRRDWYQRGTPTDLYGLVTVNLLLEFDYNYPLASDPRDRIFSLFGLACDGQNFSEFPDYSKSTEEIYTILARKAIAQGKIGMLAICRFPRNHHMPTWVPDWSIKLCWPNYTLPRLKNTGFNASNSWKPPIITFPNSKTMTTHGVFVDRIQQLGVRWEPNWIDFLDLKCACDYMDSVYELCRRSARISKESLASDAARIAIMDARIEDVEGCAVAAKECFREQVYLPLPVQTFDERSKTGSHLTKASKYAEHLRALHTRRVILSDSGYVGLAPSHTTVGDRIVLLGGVTPFIIRPDDDGCYVLVGEAYVHGIMFGEAMNPNPMIEQISLV